MINKGAQHILLCNVPNMSIIPLFKNKEKDKERILNLTTNFNKMLDGVIEELNKNKKILLNMICLQQ